jgi:Tol biopolymer transport system component
MKRPHITWRRRPMTTLGLIFALLVVAVPAVRAADLVRERIVHTTFRSANTDLYLFETPGQAPRRLTAHPALDYNPIFSPDGRWVVFCSERRGNPDLFALDLQNPGSPPRLLTPGEAMEDAPAFSPDGKRLAFVGTRDGNADIFVMPFRPEGPEASSSAVNLTRHPGGDFNPAFSPDGQEIAFASDRDGYRMSEIYVMRTDGSQVRRLTRAEGWDGSPAWSGNGESIYFYSQRDTGAGIYRMRADGSGQQQVAAGPALSPAVSPAGRLAFAARQDGRWLIVSVAADGSELRYESDRQREYWAPAFDAGSGRMICHGSGELDPVPGLQSPVPGPFLVDDQLQVQLPDRLLELWAIRGAFPSLDPTGRQLVFSEHFQRLGISRLDGSEQQTVFAPSREPVWRPHWSQDGKWIVFAVGPTFAPPSTTVDIWKLRPDGSGAVNLTGGGAANNGFPHFSPDGRQIVFRSGRDGNHELYLMNADGSNPRRLTHHAATDTMPAFSPDGKQVAFTSNREGNHELYLLDLEGEGKPGELRRLTHSPGFDTHPVFSPDGRWLVFSSQRGGLNDEEPLLPIFNPQPYGELYAVRLADGLVVRLTHNKWEDGTPAWVALPR